MKRNYEKNTSGDFINNDSFVNWVINKDNDAFWQEYRINHSDQESSFDNAIKFIKSMMAEEPDIDTRRLELMWVNILSKQKGKQRKVLAMRWLSTVAAVFVLAVATFVYFGINKPLAVDSEEFAVVDNESVQVVLSDGSVREITGDDSKITQDSDGTLVADSDTLTNKIESAKARPQNTLTQIVVPFGKRTDLYLSDGTHIYINSGSKLSFPSVFDNDKREIYLIGEAYCDVVSDVNHPFVVHTPDVDVKVTGTSFNIQAYENEEHSQAVLVEGEVTMTNRKGIIKDKFVLKPGESAEFNKTTKDFTSQKVDTEQYTSWIHGYLMLDKRSVEHIFRSLERYYNAKIRYEGLTDDITFSGKLDLKENIADVLSIIGYASSLEIEKNEGGYYVQKRGAYKNVDVK